MLQPTSCVLTALVCTAMLPSAAWSAEPAATIDASGMASARLVPTMLRMQVQVIAHGKTSELAVERLKARREAVADSLAALGAERQTVHFGDSTVSKISPPSAAGYGVPPSYAVPPSYTPTYPSAPTPYPSPTGYAPPPTSYAPATPGYGTLTPVPEPSYPQPPSASEAPSAPALPSLAPPPSPKIPAPTTTYLPPSSTSEASSAPLAATVVPAATSAVPALPPGGYTLPATAHEPARQLEVFGNVPTTTYSPPPAAPHGTTVAARARGGPQELYVALATLTIDWPLHAETVEQATVASEAIRKKVEAAGDLMRGKTAGKLPADEQELLEEMTPFSPNTTAQIISRPIVETGPNGQNVVRMVNEQVVTVSNAPGGSASGVPSMVGQPIYLYVAKITSRQRKAVYAEAFGNAKSQAAELAEASGGKLGAVSSLSGEVNGPGAMAVATSYESCRTPGAYPMTSQATPNENNGEAASTAPDTLGFQAVVHATFKLE